MAQSIALIEVQVESGERKFGLRFQEPGMLEEDGNLCPVMYMDREEATELGLKLVQWAAAEEYRWRMIERRRKRRGRG
mgnify:CR=1 FL=1